LFFCYICSYYKIMAIIIENGVLKTIWKLQRIASTIFRFCNRHLDDISFKSWWFKMELLLFFFDKIIQFSLISILHYLLFIDPQNSQVASLNINLLSWLIVRSKPIFRFIFLQYSNVYLPMSNWEYKIW